MIKHSVPLETKLATGESGLISGYASLFGGEQDDHGDVIGASCFAVSLAKHRQRGTAPSMLWAHDQSRPVGTWTEVREDSIGLAVTGRLVLESSAGREAYALLKAGAINGLSIGYIETAGTHLPGGGRRLEAVDLREISLVTIPAASDARITSVKAAGEINPKWLTQVLRDAGLSKGMAAGIVQHGWRGAIEEASLAEAAQIKQVLDTLHAATARLYNR